MFLLEGLLHICRDCQMSPLFCIAVSLLPIVFQDYRNDPKFSDRYVWANSADQDQTASRGAV